MLTSEQAIRDVVESTAAALGVPVWVVDTPDAALARWATARAVLVGGDQAAALASVAPRRRPRVYLVGEEPAHLGAWSLPLGAEVIPLPQGVSWLSQVLAPEVGAGARTIAVVGGSGGVGASTLAAGLALAAARSGLRCALIDADESGGGLDLLLGAERTPGWRWPRLLSARGEVADLRGVLPVVDGVTLVSLGREACALRAEALHAVLGALARHHDALIVDAGRVWSPAVAPIVLAADATVLMGAGHVRGLAAAAVVRERLGSGPAGVAARRARGATPADLVAEALRLPLWGSVPDERGLAANAEAGELPSHRTRWARAVGKLWERVWTEAGDVR
ncbi:MAG: P-loop NTPase [Propioniciclava sp.]|uniref:septum site-determining protein Ssd n=1 Tax=Propioniciclava sp. TaxID=2038686 RepID=UPI0039E2D699